VILFCSVWTLWYCHVVSDSIWKQAICLTQCAILNKMIFWKLFCNRTVMRHFIQGSSSELYYSNFRGPSCNNDFNLWLKRCLKWKIFFTMHKLATAFMLSMKDIGAILFLFWTMWILAACLKILKAKMFIKLSILFS